MRDSLRPAYDDVTASLRQVRTLQTRAALLKSGLIWLSSCIILLLLFLGIEAIGQTGIGPRTWMFWAFILIAISLFVWQVARPLVSLIGLLKGEDLIRISEKVGQRFPAVRDHLRNALEIVTHPLSERCYSAEFINASFEDAKRELEQVDLNSMADYTPGKRAGAIALVVTAIVGGLFLVFPETFFGSLERIWYYGESYAAPAPFVLIVSPGNRDVVKGDNVQIDVRVRGKHPSGLVLATRPEHQRAFERTSFRDSTDGVFHHELSALKLSTLYFVESGSIRSDEFSLKVIDRPVVTLFRLTLNPPRYTGQSAVQLDDNAGGVAALKGTTIGLMLEANKELADAAVVLDDGEEIRMTVNGSHASAEMRLMKENGYRFRLRDAEGLDNPHPIRYALHIVADDIPRISIELPGMNLDVAGNEQLAILMRIVDDYGFKRLRLAHRLDQSRYEHPAEEYSQVEIPIPDPKQKEQLVPFVWNLSDLHLVPEDVVSYYAEVFDNDDVMGPKTGRSEVYTLRLPSIEEVFADVDAGHEESDKGLDEILTEAKKAAEEMEDLQRELKKNQDPITWQEKKKAEELVNRYGDIQRKLDDVAQTFEKMIKQMDKNQVLSPETMEKYLELQKLMEELNSPELAEALKQLQESLGQVDPEALQEAMKQFQFSEDQFRKNLERTLNLLRRIHIEQKIDEAVRRTEQMTKEQSGLQEQTGQEEGASEELGQRQEELAQEMAKLKEELEALQKMMESFPSEMPLTKMEETLSALDSSALAEQMQEISQQLRQQRMQEAQGGQQKALQDMANFLKNLQEMQEMLRENLQQQVLNEMRKAYQELLELSRREERLKNETAGLEENSPQFRENVSAQMELSRDLARVAGRMAAIAQKSFGITPEMGRAIGDAMKSMTESMESLGQRNAKASGEHQGNAMASLNEAATQVQSAMNGMMQGGGQGIGMSGLMQRMQGISGMQRGINRGSQNLGGLGQQRAAEMARLAGEQGMVRKSLEQLAREASQSGDLSKLLGDLNRIAAEMREVQTDLAQGDVQPETLRKQERILSRLLDSQRSMRERDYEKQRQAESGKDRVRPNSSLPEIATSKDRERLQRDLLKALDEGYSKEYETLIKRYFDLLELLEHPE